MKESISPQQDDQTKEEEQQKNPKSIKKLSKDTPKKPKSYQKKIPKNKNQQLYVNLTINILNLK